MPKYQIFFSNHKAEKDWHSLEAQMPDKMDELKSFLQENPNNRSKVPGKVKKLRGRLKRLLQYDITDSYRIWYQVDSSDKAVYVEYIGPHP